MMGKNKVTKLMYVGKVFFFITVLVVVVFISYHAVFYNKVYPRVFMGGVDLSGYNRGEVLTFVQKESVLVPKTFSLASQGKVWSFDRESLEVISDEGRSVDVAFGVGRTGSLFSQLWQKKLAWFSGQSVPFAWKWSKKADDYIATLSAELERVPEEPSVTISDGKINVYPGKDGVILNDQSLKELIIGRLEYPRYINEAPILIPLVPIVGQLTPTELIEVERVAQNFVGSKITLSFSDEGVEQNWSLNESALVSFINLSMPTGEASQPKVASYTATLAIAIDRNPQNAAFRFTPTEASGVGRVSVFRPGKDGLNLGQVETIEQISAAVGLISSGGEKQQKISLKIMRSPPQISTESVNNLGIKELLGQGVSYFAGSIPGRIHNVELASSRINGILIAPGEVFSFNKNLGDISASTGYQQAYIIKGGRTVLGDGGGVCQVSTTLFRAALAAGLPIEERWAHAYRVHYYEENSPVGIDATVFSPSVDLKLTNDTGSYLLIQTAMDKKAQKLTFDLYGTSDGRKSEIGKPRVWGVSPPPPPLYQDDPTFPVGVVKQVDFSAWGAKTSFDWKVTRGTEVLQQRTFYSTYRPWQAVYLKGTRL